MLYFDETVDGAAITAIDPGQANVHDLATRDLDLVEQLIERCRREIDTSELNVKLADLVRLLEFKSKLRPSVDAEKTFWTMIDQMRRDELDGFGEPQAKNPSEK